MKDNTPRSVFIDVWRSVDPQAADESGMFSSVPIWELWRVARTNMAAPLTCGRAANEASRYLLCLCSIDASVATMAAEKDILCVLSEEFSEPNEISINTCLIMQNTLDVTVTALAIQNKREHPNQVKGFVETVVPNYCDPIFASHFRMKRQTFQLKDNPLLTSKTVLWSIWPYYFYCEY